MSVSDQVIFALKGSVVDLVDRSRVPIWSRPSSVYLEENVGGGLTLKPVMANVPAIGEDGGIYLEPANSNLVLHNLDLSQSVWQKGTNVIVSSDTIASPDSSFLEGLLSHFLQIFVCKIFKTI